MQADLKWDYTLIFYLAIDTVQSLPDLLSWRQISLKLNTNTLIEFNKETNETYTLSLYTEQVVQNEQKYEIQKS